MTAAEDRADADMVMGVLLASPNRDEPGALLAAAKAYQALKSSRDRAVRSRVSDEGATHSMSESTPVTISGTFSKDSRPSNGLEAISTELIKDQLGLHYVVGVVQFAGASVPGPNEPLVPRVKFLGIEPLKGGAADEAKRILDQARKGRGLGLMDDAIPAAPEPALFDFDGDGHPTVSAEAVTRLGPDGEREVPEASGEELLAEAEEARAAGVPSATFSGGNQ